MKTPDACLRLLRGFGVLPTHIALFTGFTRAAVSRWTTDSSSMTLPSINAVNELTYKATKQYKLKHLPLPPFAGGKAKEQLIGLLVDRASQAPDLQELTDELLKNFPNYGEVAPQAQEGTP